jgi:hypothetical protein
MIQALPTKLDLVLARSLSVLALSAMACCTPSAETSASAPPANGSPDATTAGDLGRGGATQGEGSSKPVTKPAPDARGKLARTVEWREGERDRKAWISDELVVEFEPDAEGRAALLAADASATEVPQRQQGVRIWRVASSAGADAVAREAAGKVARFSPVLHATDSADSPKSALPGGVLVAFPADWDRARSERWLADRGRELGSEVGEGLRTYLVATAPGLAALDECEELAKNADGVACEPNWWREASTR